MAKRTEVPLSVVRTPGVTSTGLDELTGADAPRLDVIPLDRIDPHPDNPRRAVGDVTELAADIAANGLDQALVVVPHPDDPARYRVVIGHRRRAAALDAGLAALPCRIREDLTPAQQRQMMVRENVHRADLTAVEEADAYQAMLDLDGLTVEQVAAAVSRSETTVRSRLRLTRLPAAARDAVHTHTATLEDAAALAEFADHPALVEELAAQLGTTNFTYALERARRLTRARAAVQVIADRLAAAGALQVAPKVTTTHSLHGSAPDGFQLVVWLTESEVLAEDPATFSHDRKRMEATIASGEISAGYTFGIGGTMIALYRPFTLEEAEAAAARDAEREAASEDLDAARSAAREAEAAARAAAEERRVFAAAADATRGTFLRGLIAKKITAAQTTALAEFAGHALLNDWLAYAEDPTPWLDLDPDAIADQATADGRDVDTAIDTATTEALAALAPANRLLVALATAIEPVSHWDMKRAGTRAWYGALEQLGYPVSDDERAAIAVPRES